MRSKFLVSINLLALFALLLASCTPASTMMTPQVITQVVKETVIAEKMVEKTVVVEKEVIVEATPAKSVVVRVTNAPLPNDKVQVARQTFLLEEFKKAHPEIVIAPSPYQYDTQTFAARFAGDTMEDTFLVAWTEPQKLIDGNFVADISPYLKDWAPLKDIKPEYLKLVQSQDGEIYGVPVYANVLGLMYRRDLFTQAGLDPNKPPQTWDELKADCAIIKEKLPDVACFGVRNEGDLSGWMSLAMQASFGQDANETQGADQKWTATFNNASMVAALKLWQELYTAGYMPKSLSWGHVPQVQDFSVGKVAMTIADGGTLQWMVGNMGSFDGVEKFDINDVGLGRLPNGGGNGSLGGGNMWLYNVKSTPEALQGAVAWNLWRDFDLTAYEQDLQSRQAAGALIGYPELQIFGGEYGKQRAAILAKYANAPVENYQNYNDNPVTIMSEPPIEAGKLKVLLGEVVQKLLTNPNADPQTELDQAVQQFQTQILDALE